MTGSFKKRFLLILIVAVAAGAMGGFGGYQLARTITARVTETKLEQYAARIIADGEASAAELRTVLAAVSASQYTPCSNDEIRYYRALIFESDFLKDAGRMRDGKIACSAALGVAARAYSSTKPDFEQQDGTKLYKSLAPYQNSDLAMITLQLGDSFVVYTPFTRLHLDPAPMHYTISATDGPSQRVGTMMGETSGASASILSTEGPARVGDELYFTRCSIRFFNCATSYTSISEVVDANRGKFAGCVAICAMAGALFGVAVSLLYRRNKGMEQQLRRAIAKDKLRLVYQPIVDLTNRSIVGAEALVRWTNEEGLAVGPDVFVRVAEERGFVGDLTRLVLRHALRDFGVTLREHPDFRLSVNVAATDLSDPQFLPVLESCLERAAVPPQKLSIEITESSTVRQEVAIDAIGRLRRHGHSVHIDDFGTGYSSLSYLQNLSVDAIKIDRSFTQAIGTESVVVAILPQILAMAEALNLAVIVEGVEKEEQARYFASQDQQVYAQGWLFGRPVPAGELQQMLVEDQKKHRTIESEEALAPAGAA